VQLSLVNPDLAGLGRRKMSAFMLASALSAQLVDSRATLQEQVGLQVDKSLIVVETLHFNLLLRLIFDCANRNN